MLVCHSYNYFITIYRINFLIISLNVKRLITGVITPVFIKPLIKKALPRRARGKNRTCPVPSCLIQRNKKSRRAMLFLLDAER
jgi:hypothetical protein